MLLNFCVLSRAEIESSSESDISNQLKEIEEEYLACEVKVCLLSSKPHIEVGEKVLAPTLIGT